MAEKILFPELTDEVAEFLKNEYELKLIKSCGYYIGYKRDYYLIKDVIETYYEVKENRKGKSR